LGLPTAVLRLIPEYDTGEQYGLLRGLLRGGRGLACGTAILAAIGATVFVASTALFPSDQLSSLLAGIWLAPILTLVGLETEILRAQRRVVWAYAPPRILRPLLLIGGIGVVSISSLPDSAFSVLGFIGGILVVTFGVQYMGTRRTVPRKLHSAHPEYEPWTWLNIAGPLFLVKGFLVAIAKTDIFVIGALLDTRQVGLYGAALRTAQAITFVGAALDSIASSAVARLHTQEDQKELQALVAGLAHMYFWPTLALAGGIAIASPYLLGLFGSEFISGRPELLVLMSGLLANASTGCQDYLLTLTGHQRACAGIYGTAMVLNFILNLVGVSLFGTVGAALATAGTMVFWNGWMYVFIKKHLDIDPTIFALLRPSHTP
jgi:O-antigen/teichoic acid export membrane protein